MFWKFQVSLCCLSAILCIPLDAAAQDCIGGQIYSQEAYLYGRFEVGMRSAEVSGVISSFFLYNLDLGCNWPAENNEIDIEMTGNSENLLFTTHYPGPFYITDTYSPAFNPHDSIHHYAIEWEPDTVRWFVDGELVTTQDHDGVDQLMYPMRIMMNLWAVDNEAWAGPWDTTSIPVSTEYTYVRCFSYTPGVGTTGTNNAFSLKWEDTFDTIDTGRWSIEQFGGFTGNFCSFESTSVRVDNGSLTLHIEAPQDHPPVPVTFSVDMRESPLEANDVIYLNGSFNNWCGTCTPMSQQGSSWTSTVMIEPGEHEYLFTKNTWEENGGAPFQSSCDYNPCDEWLNYGVLIPIGSDPISLETVCWSACHACAPLAIPTVSPGIASKVEVIYDALGRVSHEGAAGLLIYFYEDGTVEKKFNRLSGVR